MSELQLNQDQDINLKAGEEDADKASSILSSIRASKLFEQGMRYVIVGLSSAAIELLAFFLLFEVFGVFVVASNIAALSLSTAYNFTLSRNWTFKSVSSLPRSMALYLLLFIWNQLFSSWAIVGLIDMGLYAVVAKVITMAIIVCWNFVLYRKVVFK